LELGGTKHKVDGGWYFHALEFTMASLGIWPFETSKPHTEVERWLSVFFVFFTATIYAWLAGVIVELVSRAGETTRDVDGIFDGLVNYMESINLPKKKRQKFLRFFWHAKSYLRVQQIENKLPHLSSKLTGELVQFNHGTALMGVPLMNCEDKWECERFHIAISSHMETKLFDTEESITIDGMHVILEGLVINGGKVLRKGGMFGMSCTLAPSCTPAPLAH
jgi:hypothetical protein